MGSYVQEKDVRTFFTPALDYDDISKAQIDLWIESIEDYVNAVWFANSATSASNARIPCLLLIASKIVSNPTLAKKYNTLSSERLGDYSYTLATSSDGNSPYEISLGWERAALQMLRSRTSLKKFYVTLAD